MHALFGRGFGIPQRLCCLEVWGSFDTPCGAVDGVISKFSSIWPRNSMYMMYYLREDHATLQCWTCGVITFRAVAIYWAGLQSLTLELLQPES